MDTRTRTFLHKAAASVLGLGYFPFASGTVGSAAAIVLIWLLHRAQPVFFAPESASVYWLVMLAGIAASIAGCSRARDLYGSDDPSHIVLDEFIGQWLVFFMVPITARTLVLGFFLFRFFDIVKPFPVHAFEDLEGGLGITMDDVAAGVLANVSLVVVLVLYHASRAWL